MSDCKFTVPFSEEPDAIKETLTEEMKGNGGQISFSEDKGNFAIDTAIGSIAGELRMNDQSIDVAISDKPAFLPCKMIKTYLQEYL